MRHQSHADRAQSIWDSSMRSDVNYTRVNEARNVHVGRTDIFYKNWVLVDFPRCISIPTFVSLSGSSVFFCYLFYVDHVVTAMASV